MEKTGLSFMMQSNTKSEVVVSMEEVAERVIRELLQIQPNERTPEIRNQVISLVVAECVVEQIGAEDGNRERSGGGIHPDNRVERLQAAEKWIQDAGFETRYREILTGYTG